MTLEFGNFNFSQDGIQCGLVTALNLDVLRTALFFKKLAQYLVQYFIRRQAVFIFLAGMQLR